MDSGLAVARSNQEAKRLYQVEPFRKEHGHWRSEGQRQIWQALTSSGGRDFTAMVTFDETGNVANVEVQILAHPVLTPATSVPTLLGPDTKPEKNLGIPEVMPK